MKRKTRQSSKKGQQNQITLTQFQGDHITEVKIEIGKIFKTFANYLLFLACNYILDIRKG